MLNVIALVGRFTKDPELRTTPAGTSVVVFTLAVDRNYTAEDGSRPVDFITCVAWRGTAEHICKYFVKGQMAAVSGSLQVRSYTDREGTRRTAAEVRVDDVSFCGPKRESGAPEKPPLPENAPPARSGYTSDAFADIINDDIDDLFPE